MSENTARLTEGQHRVGLDFNPSGRPDVRDIKERVASLIDEMASYANDREHPGARCASIAMTEFESACMWAVKALTKQPR